jgi:VWFA-related protein
MSYRLLANRISGVCVVAALIAIGWPLTAQAPAQNKAAAPADDTSAFTIKADVELVLLDVSVHDPNGGFVSGLEKSAFAVFEDGKPQTITQFANKDVPVTIGLVIDNSGSMRAKKPEITTAGLILIQASNPKDEVFVINFNDKVRRGLPDIVPFTDDISLLRKALTRGDPAGRTSLYDAVISALSQIDMGRRDKKTLVVVSDGGDNASTHKLDEVIKMAQEEQVTIYTIGVFDELDNDRNPDVLKKLAHITGGVCYLPKKLEEVTDISRQIAKDIRTRYTLGYVPQNTDKAGTRKIRVQVQSPSGEKLMARSRTEYRIAARESTADRRAKAGARK